jgi:hypothetical protein
VRVGKILERNQFFIIERGDVRWISHRKYNTSILQSCPQSPRQLAYNIYKQCATWQCVSQRIKFSRQIFYSNLPVSTHISILSKPLNAEPWEVPPCKEICQNTFEAFGFYPCLWQICVVKAILKHDHDVISIAATGSGKTLTFCSFACVFIESEGPGMVPKR